MIRAWQVVTALGALVLLVLLVLNLAVLLGWIR